MPRVQDSLDIKFHLIDGSDIGPKSFPVAATVVSLKESILSQWPKEKVNGPKMVKDLKLISGGKILDNNKIVGECMNPLGEVPGSVTTMHVVVSQPPQEKEMKMKSDPKQQKCVCVCNIMRNNSRCVLCRSVSRSLQSYRLRFVRFQSVLMIK